MKIDEIIDQAKKAAGKESDRAFSVYLGLSTSAVANWRNGTSHPNTVTCERLAGLTGIPLARVLGIVGEARAISREEKSVWRKLAASAALLLLTINPLASPQATARVSAHHDNQAISAAIDIMRNSGTSQPPPSQPFASPSLGLSISHSGHWLAVAVANMPVGLDIEMSRRTRDYEALARFAFSPEEAARISALEPARRATAFHQLWALKEARGKRIGDGFLPEQSRKLTAIAASAGRAEAVSWAFQEGSLALAFDPGSHIDAMRIEFANGPEPAGRTYWDFRRS